MSFRSVLVVFLAVVFGIATMMAARIWAEAQRNATAPPPETVSVVVAAVDVPRFTTVSAEMLKTRNYPKDMAPQGAVTSVEDAVDRVAFMQMVKDEPLLEGKLAPRGAGRGMAPGISDGMRAFTILTSNVSSGVAGFILPGAKVDVHLTVSGIGANETTGGSTSTILLQNVEVLAVDQRVDAPAENKVDANYLRSVTLLVIPEQATKLTLGQTRGTLHLSLRNPHDQQRVEARPITLSELVRLPEEVKPAAPVIMPVSAPVLHPVAQRDPARIRTFRGTNAGFVEVD